MLTKVYDCVALLKYCDYKWVQFSWLFFLLLSFCLFVCFVLFSAIGNHSDGYAVVMHT